MGGRDVLKKLNFQIRGFLTDWERCLSFPTDRYALPERILTGALFDKRADSLENRTGIVSTARKLPPLN
jgi:hypothetical protein